MKSFVLLFSIIGAISCARASGTTHIQPTANNTRPGTALPLESEPQTATASQNSDPIIRILDNPQALVACPTPEFGPSLGDIHVDFVAMVDCFKAA